MRGENKIPRHGFTMLSALVWAAKGVLCVSLYGGLFY